MTVLRGDIASHLEYGIKTNFLKSIKSATPMRNAIAQEVSSDGKAETYADLGTPSMPVETIDTPNITGVHEVSLIVTNKDYDLTIKVSHNAINDARVGNLDNWARQAGLQFIRHQDKICFEALNTGDLATSLPGYDGKRLFANDHFDENAVDVTPQDNLLALGGLTTANYKTARVAALRFLDARGEECNYNFNTLIVPPELENEAAQITDNAWAFGTANREINPYNGARRIVTPYLDTTAWILVAGDEMVKPLIFQMRQAPQLTVWDDENAPEGGMRYFKWSSRYAVAPAEWRTAIMGNS